MSTDTRLIERWLPIAAIGEESVRERRSMTALPPTYYLHVWWARRPLVASRAAVMASLLPSDADRSRFVGVLGIHGDPVQARRLLDRAERTGVRIDDPYGYPRAFSYTPTKEERDWLAASAVDPNAVVLDPTAGGGTIPYESARLGFATFANDLNPVAALILRGTVEWPANLGPEALRHYDRIAKVFRKTLEERLTGLFPQLGSPDKVDATYLWASTITCPYCDGLVPLSLNWKLTKGGVGVRLKPTIIDGKRVCSFEIVTETREHSKGTVSSGDATCPFDNCRRVIDGDDIKKQAQSGGMGAQLYAIVYRRRILTKTRTGRPKEKWVREFRNAMPEDVLAAGVDEALSQKIAEWEVLGYIPTEDIPAGLKTAEPIRYGMKKWRDLFSPRQLFCHGTSVEAYRELLSHELAKGPFDEARKAAFVYLAFALDKMLDRNSRMSRWIPQREVVANTFDTHDFSIKWAFLRNGSTRS
jgi:adenine-specific DNA methylase